eukprot:TRINITY_DN3897_c0_g1_i4.p1 TRINITY_DN3897_c0_g1~~TRINITY_DN3897_c0_g1_i4.p1  ORF type:complete len:114 (+),score=24.96 TRINITY_DN3897_c0_g1_i4:156-497(+)
MFSDRFLSNPETFNIVVKELIDAKKRPGGKQSMFGLWGQLAAIRNHKVSKEEFDIIKASRVPVLIVTGSEDSLVDPRNSEDMNEYLSPSEYLVIQKLDTPLTWRERKNLTRHC